MKRGASAVSLMEFKPDSVSKRHTIPAIEAQFRLPGYPINEALIAIPAVIVVHHRYAWWLACTIASLVGDLTL
jgi:hypothetical protein